MKLQVKYFTSLNKVRGLIGTRKPQSIVFKTRFGIHTFGLKFPIDILILDKDGQVVKLVQGIKPNRILVWNPKYDTVIELPEGTVQTKKIKLGSKIDIAKT